MWLQIILGILGNLPTIIRLIKEIMGLINKIPDRKLRRERLKELRLTLRRSRETGRYDEVHTLFAKLEKDVS